MPRPIRRFLMGFTAADSVGCNGEVGISVDVDNVCAWLGKLGTAIIAE